MEQTVDPIKDLKQMLSHSSGYETNRICHGCPLNNLAQEMSPLDNAFRRNIEKLYNAWRLRIADAYSSGIQADNVRKDA